MRKLLESIEKRKTLLLKLPGSQEVQPLVNRHRLIFAISSAIVVSLLLTVFSILLYVVTGTSKLDLSRPGYEEVRQKITKTPPSTNSFEPNGSLDSKIIDDYLKRYKDQSQSLSKYDTFNSHLLDDAPLGLSTVQVGPSDGTSP